MTLDQRDIELLRLAGKYRWLPYKGLGKFGFGSGLADEIGILSTAGLMKISQDKSYIRPTPQGCRILLNHGHDYGPGSDRPYTSVSSLRRRLEVSSIMLTALRAGIDVLLDDIEALSRQPSFFPAFDLRNGGTNMMSAASCAGFGHWGDKGYMLQYVSPESCGMYLTNELTQLRNMSAIFDPALNAPLAMIFAGPRYGDVYKQLTANTPSARHGKHSFYDYWDVYRKTDMPIHLLSCDETGAGQLALMRQPDYNARIARAALGDAWIPYDEQIPDADGCLGGDPLVIAADMDVRRVQRVCAAARELGRGKVMIAAFKSQINEFYAEILPDDSFIKRLSISQPILDKAFGNGFSLYSMESD